ncbi:uncharacterized protein A4U43_UnF9940 [Asparagus officinalis]|uniref:U1-type domain-containing protein n=1 Tax=Asparagus officinalis TaxID=4686 RepID=A0A1R3L5L0_ASPOF|nr:UBP1-associated proteins 1C [Asparagus officinalis]ONK54900.1 uncharacterized protein A4U43_UnF9940 [Asparagus officinalis]
MVWFQCEDCGENLKKPKLANHFRLCSAYKLSCIDCGKMFDQESVQSHTQCMTEAEKYGPKGQGNVSNNGQTKIEKPKKNSDVDINVGLSSHAPWFCSLCNTNATSKQALLLHADGKKHRAKARAFHASQKQSSQTEETTPKVKEAVADDQLVKSVEGNGSSNKVQESDLSKDSDAQITRDDKDNQKKRKVEGKNAADLTNGEVIQAGDYEASKRKTKKKKSVDESLISEEQEDKQRVKSVHGKIRWKKLVTSTLKSSDGVMKIKKLQKLILKGLKESGVTEDEELLRDKLMQEINSTNRFSIENKRICLVGKTGES